MASSLTSPALTLRPEEREHGVTRVHLVAYNSFMAFPESCDVCGDDLDLHEWWEVKDGLPINCDRN